MDLGQRPNAGPGTTARRILEHARRAFNERGVAAVGIRDLARELGLSPGNLSYHFATKEALIAALVDDVHAMNNEVAAPSGLIDFTKLDQIIRNIMQRDADHQWLTRDAIGLMLSLPTLRARHQQLQRAREGRIDGVIDRLIEACLLDRDVDRSLLRLQVLTQIFFWVPSSRIAAPDCDLSQRLDLHARAVLALFLPYATPAGRRQLAPLVRSRPAAATAVGERRPVGARLRARTRTRS